MHDDSRKYNRSYLNWGPIIAPLDAGMAPPGAADAPPASGAVNWLSV